MKGLFLTMLGITAIVAGLQMGCGNMLPAEDEAVPITETVLPPPELGENGRPIGWTEHSHSNDADPNYAAVFPDNEVKRLDILIASSDWQAMQDNMTALYGEPGAGNGGGGFPGGGGFDGEAHRRVVAQLLSRCSTRVRAFRRVIRAR